MKRKFKDFLNNMISKWNKKLVSMKINYQVNKNRLITKRLLIKKSEIIFFLFNKFFLNKTKKKKRVSQTLKMKSKNY